MRILIYDVHASESGALSILNDLYKQIYNYVSQDIQWIFAVSISEYREKENIKILKYPWVKKSWLHRLYFNKIITRNILKEYKPDKVLSLQNEGITFYKGLQFVYLHLSFILCDYKFKIGRDGLRLWLYQNIINRIIFSSYKKVDKIIVQTNWMKEALVKKNNINAEKIFVIQPQLFFDNLRKYVDRPENRKRFFYPATSFAYKNHMLIVKACEYLKNKNITDYEVTFTLKGDENEYAKSLYKRVIKNELNINFIGTISRENVFQKYSESVLIFPSFVESFGLPLLEARLSKTFILASDCPFSHEILENYKNVEYFDSDDYVRLADIIVDVINEVKIYDADDTVNADNLFDTNENTLIDFILGTDRERE